MALIRGAFGGGQIKGSIAGVTFQQGKFGTVIRNRTVPVNPNSPKQVAIRLGLSIASNAWVTVLTGVERQAWEDYAQGTPIPNAFGDPVIVAGRTMYLRANIFRLSVGLPPVNAAPSTPGVGVPCDLTITGDTTDGIEVIASSPVLVPGDVCAVLIGLPVNQSRNFYKTPFTFVAGLSSSTTLPLNLKPAAEVAIGQRFFVSNRLFAADGKVSNSVIDQINIDA